MTQFLKGRTVIVTGAGGGIGQELVSGCLKAGANVLGIDRDKEGHAKLRSRIDGPSAERLRWITIDIRDLDTPDLIVQEAMAEFGGIFALVNNAAIGRSYFWKRTDRGPKFWEVARSTTEEFFSINVLAPIAITTAVTHHLLAAKEGRIVTLSTSFFSMLAEGMHPYGNSKSAIEAFAAIAANDLAGTGITSNVLNPGGAVNTNMVLNRPGISRSDLIQPDALLAPLLWLLSDEAKEVTGRRLTAHLWDASKPTSEALAAADSPIAWSAIAAGTKRVASAKS